MKNRYYGLIRLVTALALITISSLGYTQCSFHKIYDTNQENNDGISVIEIPDGSFISCGNSSSAILVQKFTSCGDTIWTRTYDIDIGGDIGRSIVRANDTSCVISGSTYNSVEGAQNTFLMSISFKGDSNWYREINVGFNDIGYIHKKTTDEGFIIGGFRNVLEDSSLFMIKTDALGNTEWLQYYGTPNYERTRTVDLTPDGGYVLMGDINNGGQGDIFITKVDSLGNEEWTNYYDSQTGFDNGGGFGLTTQDSGFIFVASKEQVLGSGDEEAWVVKTDASGIVEWESSWNLAYDFYNLNNIRQLPNGQYLATGHGVNYTGNTGTNVWIVQLDENGDSLWTKEYNYYGGDNHTFVDDMELTKDGGFILSGYIIDVTTSGDNDLWLLKVDSLGNVCSIVDTTQGCSTLDCNYITANITVLDTVNIGDTINLQGNEFANNWSWNYTTGIDTLQNSAITYTDTGMYDITLVVTYDTLCYDSVTVSVVVLDTVTGILNFELSTSHFRLYPNPNDGNMVLDYSIAGEQSGIFVITNVMGEVVTTYPLLPAQSKLTISEAALKNGVYFYQVVVDETVVKSAKIILVK